MSLEEFSRTYLHQVGTMTIGWGNNMELKDKDCRENIPSALDWSKNGVVTGVKHLIGYGM